MDYKKVTREEAKSEWENGERIYLLPSRVEYIEGRGISVFTDNQSHEDFDRFVDDYRNVTSTTGLSRMSFYKKNLHPLPLHIQKDNS